MQQKCNENVFAGSKKLSKGLLQSNSRTSFGTNRKQRDKMITEFQEPDTPPAIFILSLKAGGVGITLTQANQVALNRSAVLD